MSYVLKVFVDQVWIGNNSSESERRSAVIYAASFSAVVFVLTVVESNTESWMVKDMKLGFTVKQLRDSMATQVGFLRCCGKQNIKDKYNDICTIETLLSFSPQLLWADDGRLSIQRSADYLNSVVNEVRIIHNVHRLNINR